MKTSLESHTAEAFRGCSLPVDLRTGSLNKMRIKRLEEHLLSSILMCEDQQVVASIFQEKGRRRRKKKGVQVIVESC